MDYAEARAGLEGLLVAAARDAGRVRVLLLARQPGEWWERLGGGGGVVRDMVRDASLSPLALAGDISPGIPGDAVVQAAVPLFAARLGVVPPDPALVSVTGAGELRVLDLHAAALVAVLASRRQPAGAAVRVDAPMVLAELLGHEKHYWRGRADAAGLLSGPGGLSMAQLSQVVAAGCLLGVSAAAELAARVPGVPVTGAVASWLRDLYPPDGDGQLGALRPDRLAELHVTRELAASPALAQACLTGLDARQARRALILLARASADQRAARSLLEPALFRFPEVIGGLAEPREVMIAVADAIPYPSLALAEAHASISGRIAETYEPGTAGRALWLDTCGVLLGAVGRLEEALAATGEAVAIRRELASARPDAFTPDLAMSLNNQSGRLASLGRREEALAAIEEAVAIRRELASARPDAFTPALASALNNQSNQLAGLGRREEALAAIEEAVAIRRELASARPDAFTPDLATSLNNQSNQLASLGRREEALAAIEEAAALYRELARARPDAFTPDLATALNNQSNRLADLGRREEALAAIEEAVAIRRELASARPDAFTPDLATSLNNQSACLADLGRREEALAAIEEAAALYRELARARPDAFTPDLATALNNQSACLADLGRREEALAAIEEAVAIRRELASARPDAFTPDLATSLNNQSNRLADLGRREEALAAIEEAVAIRRELASARPDAFTPDLATSLNNQSLRLADLGRREEALAAIEEAAALVPRAGPGPPRCVHPRPGHGAEQPVGLPGGSGAAGGGAGRDRGSGGPVPRAGPGPP